MTLPCLLLPQDTAPGGAGSSHPLQNLQAGNSATASGRSRRLCREKKGWRSDRQTQTDGNAPRVQEGRSGPVRHRLGTQTQGWRRVGRCLGKANCERGRLASGVGSRRAGRPPPGLINLASAALPKVCKGEIGLPPDGERYGKTRRASSGACYWEGDQAAAIHRQPKPAPKSHRWQGPCE